MTRQPAAFWRDGRRLGIWDCACGPGMKKEERI